MPWEPSYSVGQARAAIEGADTWRQVLAALGMAYHGKNISTLRKWAESWEISLEHLSDLRGLSGRRLGYSEEELRRAVAESSSWAETLRELGRCSTGGNWTTLKRKVAALGIPTDHFDPYLASRHAGRRIRKPLQIVLVEGSTYSRSALKQRLYEEGLKERRCELCHQDETWRGRKMGLILDHVNGVRDDNRLANLRVVCPNCAATFDTHCGRKNREPLVPRECRRCGQSFAPRYPAHRYCSRECGTRWDRAGRKRLGARKAERPPHHRLAREIGQLGYSAVGRKYGVSDNAIRKWMRAYEQDGLLGSATPNPAPAM